MRFDSGRRLRCEWKRGNHKHPKLMGEKHMKMERKRANLGKVEKWRKREINMSKDTERRIA